MKTIQELASQVKELEQQLASDIAMVSAELEPLPGVEVMDHVMALFMDSMHRVANLTADKQGADDTRVRA